MSMASMTTGGTSMLDPKHPQDASPSRTCVTSAMSKRSRSTSRSSHAQRGLSMASTPIVSSAAIAIW